ncbi:type B 50S ribosomal protein L31 [Candidatus Saccharibacteria bacterium]|jgi:ribosomal protein L31|nr:type B 50S ribosomal protein L31 [Candidatus Saccharibacteria bacterium]MBB1579968.1 type B 50S ribosomal protein L31 [Candidatus Saccharibacteria bacterium]
MKSSIHPQDYRLVVFSDEQAGFAFLTRSTAQSTETIKWKDGQTYPLVKVHISSKSHPFFTGEEKIIDTEGRVDRFKARQAAAKARREALVNKAKKANAAAAAKAQQAADDKTSDNNAKPAKTSKKAKKQVNEKN